jgi:AbrB family looped-hinge helix DNA binding protein
MDRILGSAKIRKKGQITIPKTVSDYLKIKPGEKLVWIWEQGKVVIKREKTDYEDFKVEP